MDQPVRLATEPALAECAGQDLRVWQCTSLVALDTLYKNSNTACTICRRHMFAKTNKQSPEKKATGGETRMCHLPLVQWHFKIWGGEYVKTLGPCHEKRACQVVVAQLMPHRVLPTFYLSSTE